MKQTISILGAGAFGTSIANLIADNGYKVKLWCYEEEVLQSIKTKQENTMYFSGIKLNPNIIPTNDLEDAIKSSQWIFEAIPVKFLRNILTQTKDYFAKDQIIVSLSKGIEQETLFLPTQIIDDVFSNDIKKAVMAGPNFAKEIAQKYLSATTICSEDEKITAELSKILSNSYFKTEISQDLIGIQVGGAIKNVITLAAGIAQGFNSSLNTNAYLITKGLREIEIICKALGGNEKTISDLAGLGDLILSATGSLSRNLRVGELLGQGKTLKDIEKEFKTLPEGINTTKSVYDLIQKHKLELPICLGTYQVIFEGKSVNEFLDQISD